MTKTDIVPVTCRGMDGLISITRELDGTISAEIIAGQSVARFTMKREDARELAAVLVNFTEGCE